MGTREAVIAGAARTAIGSFNGVFAEVPAPALGAVAARAALQRSGMDISAVEELIFGNVLSAGLGQNVARQVAIGAGLPPAVGATTVNKVCGSGLKSVMLAAQGIACGDADVVLAGGTENMSRAPYLLPKARNGYRMGHGEIIDSMIRDGLWDVYNDLHMGLCGERCVERFKFTRRDQDDFAVASYHRALQAMQEGAFKQEVVPVEIKQRKGTMIVDTDESPSRFNEEKLRALPPVFAKEGTITAGNASSISDGAAAVVVLSAERAQKLGVKPQARILGFTSYAREPEWFTLAPVGALERLMRKLDLTVEKVDLFEINEAFSVVTMAAMQEMKIPHEKVNVHGGAVALGHPIGASGARTLVTLLHAMERRGARLGITTLCIGGGEAVAMAVERLS